MHGGPVPFPVEVTVTRFGIHGEWTFISGDMGPGPLRPTPWTARCAILPLLIIRIGPNIITISTAGIW